LAQVPRLQGGPRAESVLVAMSAGEKAERGREWAAQSARTLARRLRRTWVREQGATRAQAIARRTKALREALGAHWAATDLLGKHCPTFGHAVKALRLVGVTDGCFEHALALGNWARHSPPPGAQPIPSSPPRGVVAHVFEHFRGELFSAPVCASEDVDVEGAAEDKPSFGSADCRFDRAVVAALQKGEYTGTGAVERKEHVEQADANSIGAETVDDVVTVGRASLSEASENPAAGLLQDPQVAAVDEVPAHLVGASGYMAMELLRVGPGGIRPPISAESAIRLMERDRERERRQNVVLPECKEEEVSAEAEWLKALVWTTPSTGLPKSRRSWSARAGGSLDGEALAAASRATFGGMRSIFG
jgi:hypothetical protein